MCGLSALHDVDNFVLRLIIYKFKNINSFLILQIANQFPQKIIQNSSVFNYKAI